MVVAVVAFIDVDAAGFDLGQRRPIRQLRPRSVAVEGIVVRRLGLQHQLAAPAFARAGFWACGRESPPTPCSRTHKERWLYLAGTFDLRSVERTDLAAASVSVALKPPSRRA